MISRRRFLKMGLAGSAAALVAARGGQVQQVLAAANPGASAKPAGQTAAQTPLAGSALPQFVDELPTIDIVSGGSAGESAQIKLHMREFKTRMLPSGFVPANGAAYTGTTVWGYLLPEQLPEQPNPMPRETYLGPIVLAERGTPTEMHFINELGTTDSTNLLAYKNSTDQTLHWADPLNGEANMCNMMLSPMPMDYCAQNYSGPIPAVVHLHGGEVPPSLDGGPDAWVTSDGQYKGHGFYTDPNVDAAPNEMVYRYPNLQESALIWFHDHTLGATRLNVYAGLAGGYYINDPVNGPSLSQLPTLVPMVIQDRMFDTNGELYFPAALPFTPNAEHPFWVPEFLGDVICVNGKTWPKKSVEQKRYMFSIVNGSNARTYEMFLVDQATKVMGPPIWQVATDGGWLDKPVKIDPNSAVLPRLVMMPGERAIIIVDFTNVPVGSKLLLRNVAKAPYPGGATPQGGTAGRIMQFVVTGPASTPDNSYNPASGALLPKASRFVSLISGGKPAVMVKTVRQLTLNEIMGMAMAPYPGGPLEILVNNTKWGGESPRTYNDFTPITLNGVTLMYSEIPEEGTTEQWEFINLTADAHPMHTHLTQFQILNRQAFDVKKYTAVYNAAFPAKAFTPDFGPSLNYNIQNADKAIGGNPAVSPFLKGAARPPAPNELGWKDTILTPPGMVTRILVRYAPTDTPATTAGVYPFEPADAEGHNYVWHCHIVDHEDNEMMRPLVVATKPGVTRSFVKGTDY